MSTIFRIPENISVKIAAGEVIERPSSVIKELFDNAIDAQANNITIEIESGGKKLIRFTDDGTGMSQKDARLSLERFTTSKLSLDSNLFENITTFGFRGEALASIASVSRLNLKTKRKEDDSATVLFSEAGKIKEETKEAFTTGTSIEVKNLFFNIPVRKKFLKTDKTEQGHIEDTVLKLALPHQHLSLDFIADDKKIFSISSMEPLRDRCTRLFSKNKAPTFEIHHSAGEYSLEGLVTQPGLDFRTSSNIITFVNGRIVKDRILNHAVCEAFRTHIMSSRYPGALIFLHMPPGDVDVNVHPTKAEVKFLNPGFIHSFVEKSISHSFSEKTALISKPPDKLQTASVKDHIFPFRHSPYSNKSFKRPGNDFFANAKQQIGQRSKGYYSSLNILGQLKNSYILCSDEKGLVIIDQHAAHERITFERLKENMSSGKITIQELLFPNQFELKTKNASTLKSTLHQFKEFGFDIDEFGENIFMLRGVPELLTKADHVKLIEDMLDALNDYSSSNEKEKIKDEIISSMACHSSVRFSQSLSNTEIASLLRDLDRIEAVTCPHGRPFSISLDENELKKLFKRT